MVLMPRRDRVGRSTPQRRYGRRRGSRGDGSGREPVRRLAIIGAGAWGTALAIAARRAGSRPVLWTRNRDVAAAVNERHENALLHGVALHPGIAATTEFDLAVGRADAALLVIPAQFLRGVLEAHRHQLPTGLPLLHC